MPLLLLPKPNPLRWASVWFWAQTLLCRHPYCFARRRKLYIACGDFLYPIVTLQNQRHTSVCRWFWASISARRKILRGFSCLFVYNEVEQRCWQKGGARVREQEIIAWIRARDERGVEALLKHYGPLMRYIIAPILPNRQDQDDCLSEAAMRIWDKIEFYDPARGTWRAWLTALTRNAALNHARQNQWHSNPAALSAETPSPEPTPEERVLQQEQTAALHQALQALSPKDRTLFYRKYYYLQTTAQIASELGMTERAVEGRIYRLKQRLRKALGGEEHV